MISSFVYMICAPDGGIYVGKTLNLELRIRCHKRKSSNERLRRAFAKHGESDFSFYVLEHFEKETRLEAENSAYEAERIWIEHFREIGEDLINQNAGGLGSIDPSDETRRKMSEAAKGNTRCRGKRLPEETKAKIAKRARNPTTEQREKMSIAASKRIGSSNPFFGRKHSEATKAKIAEANRQKRQKQNQDR